MALAVSVALVLWGCASVSTDDLTFTNGIFLDRTRRPYTGTAYLTVKGMLVTGIGTTEATIPYKLKIQQGRVVAVKKSSSPFAGWIPFSGAKTNANQHPGPGAPGAAAAPSVLPGPTH